METWPLIFKLDKLITINLVKLSSDFVWFKNFIYFCGQWLGWFIIFGLIIYFLITRPKILALKNVGFILVGGVVSWLISFFVKSLIWRPRPFELINNLPAVFRSGDFESFPSAHVAFFGALALFVWRINRRLGLVFIILAMAVGLARIFAGSHWFSDILGGWAIALFVFWLPLFISQKIKGIKPQGKP